MFGWKSAKDKLIEALERENAFLRQQLAMQPPKMAPIEAAPLAVREAPVDDVPKRSMTMQEWCRRQSLRSYAAATSKGKTPLVAGVPVGAVNPETSERAK